MVRKNVRTPNLKKVIKNTYFYVRVSTIDDVSDCRWMNTFQSPIVDKRTTSTKIALQCCFGRKLFVLDTFWYKGNDMLDEIAKNV